MKKTVVFGFVFAFALMFSFPVLATNGNNRKQAPAFVYTDTETGLKFTVPDGWKQTEILEGQEYVRAKFITYPEDGSFIVYGCADLWDALPEESKAGLHRIDIDSNTISLSDMAGFLGINGNDLTSVTYNNKQYFKIHTNIYIAEQPILFTQYFSLDNGIFYFFQTDLLTEVDEAEKSNDFVALISSIQYPTTTAVGMTGVDIFYDGLLSILMGFLITFFIHPVPIWLYRYTIRKAPFPPKKARKIAFFDAVVVFIVMFAITPLFSGSSGSLPAIFMWSFVCYATLKVGYVSPQDTSSIKPENSPRSESFIQDSLPVQQVVIQNQSGGDSSKPSDMQNPVVAPRIRFCRYCGTELVEGSKYCNNCGKQIK